jgi:hypothetical protein
MINWQAYKDPTECIAPGDTVEKNVNMSEYIGFSLLLLKRYYKKQ